MHREQTGALSTVLMEQVEALHDYYALFVPQLALAVLIPLSVATAVFTVSWTAGVLLLVTGPLIPLFTILVGIGAESISRRHFQSLARLSAHFLDALQGITTLKLFGRSKSEGERIARTGVQYRRHTMQVLRVAFLSSAVLEFFASLAIAMVAIYLGMSYLGYLDFGTYGRGLSLADGLFILLLAPEYYQPLRELGTHYHARAQALAAAEKIRSILESPMPAPIWDKARPILKGGIGIRCRDLCFAHDGEREAALKKLDMEVHPGSFTAVVGGSGAGKSTILNLLLGFIKPDGGDILVNGTPLHAMDPDYWRSRVGWIGQNPCIFQGTLHDNIVMGRTDIKDEEVMEAARSAKVLDFARQLPHGLQSAVAEKGAGLSRGQAQRLALARAILQKPPLLLLDEPTAGLDTHTEASVFRTLETLRGQCTVVLVTHRLAHIHRVDHIHVMHRGKIIEHGSYEELLETQGFFQRMVASPDTE